MNSKKPPTATAPRTIAENRKARHDYFIEEQLEAGLSLEGWEVKSLRPQKAKLRIVFCFELQPLSAQTEQWKPCFVPIVVSKNR